MLFGWQARAVNGGVIPPNEEPRQAVSDPTLVVDDENFRRILRAIFGIHLLSNCMA